MKVLKSTTEEIIIELSTRSGDGREEGTQVAFDLTGSEQDLSPLFAGPIWNAFLWENSVAVMCAYLEAHRDITIGRTVVELGCCLGVPGMVASLSGGARHVFLTDRNDDLRPLRRALELNS